VCGFLEAKNDQVPYACAGDVDVLHLRAGGWQSLANPSADLAGAADLGSAAETSFCLAHAHVRPGESLIVCYHRSDATCSGGHGLAHVDEFARALSGRHTMSAKGLAAFAQSWFNAGLPDTPRPDWTVLVAKRTDP
jgi:hypothetical protein